MSVTYLLSSVSQPSSSSTVLPPSPAASASNATAAAQEQGHIDAIWSTKWATKAGGGEVVVTGSADHTLNLWNPEAPAHPMRTLRSEKALGVVAVDVDKAATGASFLISSTIDSVITRWSIDGEHEARKTFGPAETWDVSLHPQSEVLSTAGADGKVMVLSSAIDTFGDELATHEAKGTFITAVEYSKGGNLLAVASEAGYVTLFDAETGSLISSFPAHSAPIRSLSFTSNLLVTGSDDKRINVFDLRTLTASHAGASSSSSSSGGGRRGQVASLGGHEGWVVQVAARNDRLLASGSSDGTIKLFDLAAPSLALSTLHDHTGDVWSLAWAPEASSAAGAAVEGLGGAAAGLSGGRMVSAGEDGRVRWWTGGGS